jgi:hypothetical protein
VIKLPLSSWSPQVPPATRKLPSDVDAVARDLEAAHQLGAGSTERARREAGSVGAESRDQVQLRGSAGRG